MTTNDTAGATLRYVGWAGALAALGLSGAGLWRAHGVERDMLELNAATPEAIEAMIADGGGVGRPPAYRERLAERAADLPVPNVYSALVEARAALDADPGSAYAFAHVAYLVSKRDRAVTPEAIEALRRSAALCRTCDAALALWRTEFVVSDWWRMPLDLQADARAQSARLSARDDRIGREARALEMRAAGLGVPLAQ